MSVKALIPNLLTALRLVLTLLMFAGFVAFAWVQDRGVAVPTQAIFWLLRAIVICFVVAAITDFFDGWLARRWNVESVLGAILDPIADKILVCAAALGLIAIHVQPSVVLPVGLILFREFAVSALREVLAPKGLSLPVTMLAKIKTSLQLVALGAVMVVWFAPALGYVPSLEQFQRLSLGASGLMWLAALVTLWTGTEYAFSAHRALKPKA
jgi:CDP-diacylglycerol--glycerol-3-phosphate 3-phosphatidyltransferase